MRGVLVLGCGYTGRRVVARLRARGARVVAADASAAALALASAAGATAVWFDATRPGTWTELVRAAADLAGDLGVLLSLPPLGDERGETTAALLRALPRPARVVYLSTTAVHGHLSDVDESTPSQATTGQVARLAAERVTVEGPWSWMILRAAAIYGPERGLHVAEGAAPRRTRDPHRVVSRIHVDDLAAICEAALEASVTGAFPVADLEPATAREIAAFCASVGVTPAALPEGPAPAGSCGRRVDGRAVLRALGVSLAYPSYRAGIVAAARARAPERGR